MQTQPAKKQGIKLRDKPKKGNALALAKELDAWTGATAVYERRGKHGAICLSAKTLEGQTLQTFIIVANTASDWRADANNICKLRRCLRSLGARRRVEVEDTHADTEARAWVPKVVPIGEPVDTRGLSKRTIARMRLDRSKPYWRVVIDGIEAAAFQTFDELLGQKWPANAFVECVPEPTKVPCVCALCGAVKVAA